MRSALLIVPLLFSVALYGQTQNQSQTTAGSSPQTSSNAPPQQSAPVTPKPAPTKPLTPAEQRQAQLQADTAKLYQLTQELKAEVAKSNKDTLSVSVIKKADEIEKLARSLKERMRTSQ